jgi:hypothetical protein
VALRGEMSLAGAKMLLVSVLLEDKLWDINEPRSVLLKSYYVFVRMIEQSSKEVAERPS